MRRRWPARVPLLLIAAVVALLAAAPAAAEVRDRAGSTGSAQIDTTPLPPEVTAAGEGSTGGGGVSATGAVAKMVVGLAVVLAVIFGVYWLLKSAGRAKRAGAGASGAIGVVSTAPLAPGKTLHLVRVGSDFVLVGAAEQSVSGVHSWSGDDARKLEATLAEAGQAGPAGVRLPPPGGGRFVEELRRRTARG